MAATEQEVGANRQIAGLTEAEAAERVARGEHNVSEASSSRSYKRIVAQNAITPINLTLFAICVGLAAVGLVGDAAMTGGLVVLNVVVGVFQEVRAKQKLDRISLLTRPSATVIRDGKERTVEPQEIVIDDAVVLEPGDQVLVDGTVLSENGLTIDESLLTGESDLIYKHAGDSIRSGTFAMGGSGVYQAEKVGAQSTAQQLTARARKFRNAQTPLQREVGFVLRLMAVIVALLSFQVISAYRGDSDITVDESLRAAAVLVGLVPQGLSFMVTTTYAMAVIRMAGTGALIQRINAVESTSNINLLCVDKTGTLTTNNLAIERIEALDGDQMRACQLLGDFSASVQTSNKTSEAILSSCQGTKREPLAEVAFSSARKWSAIEFDDGVYVLGAPEMLARALPKNEKVEEKIAEQTAEGFRVLLFARSSGGHLNASDDPQLPEGLEPIALVVLSDELRAEARDTIEKFSRAGIGLKIISGDSAETVAALARQAGFSPDLRSVSGLTLDAMSDSEIKKVAEESTVFGRITPEQKERLIRALRKRGRHVAMVGDGVNDVLALKQADLAIAMKSGSQVTRSVADIVLLDDSFATLPKAFIEGQRVRRGMLDIIRLFLVRTLSVALVILAVTLVGSEFPTTPRQNGALAFLTVGFPTLALAAWARPAPTPKRLVFSSGFFVMTAALSIALASFAVYEFFLAVDDVDTARTALTTTAILCGLLMILFTQPPNEWFVGGAQLNGDWRVFPLTGVLLLLYVLIAWYEPARDFYELESLSVWSYLVIAGTVTAWMLGIRVFWRWDIPGLVRRFWRWATGKEEWSRQKATSGPDRPL